jgi:hypothetical protein
MLFLIAFVTALCARIIEIIHSFVHIFLLTSPILLLLKSKLIDIALSRSIEWLIEKILKYTLSKFKFLAKNVNSDD